MTPVSAANRSRPTGDDDECPGQSCRAEPDARRGRRNSPRAAHVAERDTWHAPMRVGLAEVLATKCEAPPPLLHAYDVQVARRRGQCARNRDTPESIEMAGHQPTALRP